MPLSETRCVPRRHADGEIDRGLERRFEGPQVAVVDADELGVERQRAVQLDLVVHLDQRVHPPFGGGVEQVARGVVADRGEDDQDAVGAPGAGLGDLVGLEHEVLAQHRQLRRGAGLDQVVRRALEARAVGEHRQAGGAAQLIGAGDLGRVEVGADQALGRAGLLDLGDQRVLAGGALAP